MVKTIRASNDQEILQDMDSVEGCPTNWKRWAGSYEEGVGASSPASWQARSRSFSPLPCWRPFGRWTAQPPLLHRL